MTEKRNMIGIFGNFRELSTLGIANILTTAIGGIFWLYIANLLGAEKYGEISYILGIAGIAVTLSSLGSNNTIIVFVAKGEKIHAPISLLVIAVGIISSFIIFNIFEDFGAGIYVLGSLIFGLVTSEFLGLKMYKNYAGLVVSQRILMICLSIILYHIIGHDGIIFGIGLSFFPYTYRLYHFFKDRTVDFSLIKEKKSLNILCRGAAMRYFLTRLYDYTNTPKTALIKIKDPREYYQKLVTHNNLKIYKHYIN